jgi:hypothetical protein
MKTSSAKAKGRHLQQLVCAELRTLCGETLEEDDITSRGMGQQGEDVILTPAARKLLGKLAIECKNQEALNVTSIFHEHAQKYPEARAVLVHKRNRTEPLVTITLVEYMRLQKYRLYYRRLKHEA